MDVYESHRYRETSIYGSGSPGGKGTGLVTLNECDLPRTRKLPTHILSTSFYDRYVERGHALGAEELAVIASILDDLGDIPIGVRSSATNEGVAQDQRSWAIHAGENTSFMLPNNHWDRSVRLQQLTSAIRHIKAVDIYADSLTERCTAVATSS